MSFTYSKNIKGHKKLFTGTALRIARMTGTAVVYMRDGNLVFEHPGAPESSSNALADGEANEQNGGELL